MTYSSFVIVYVYPPIPRSYPFKGLTSGRIYKLLLKLFVSLHSIWYEEIKKKKNRELC